MEYIQIPMIVILTAALILALFFDRIKPKNHQKYVPTLHHLPESSNKTKVKITGGIDENLLGETGEIEAFLTVNGLGPCAIIVIKGKFIVFKLESIRKWSLTDEVHEAFKAMDKESAQT